MVRIVADTSTMYSTETARAAGFDVAPLAVTIAGKTYKELDEIQLEEFVSIIGQGHMPVSSQPALGDVIAMYEACGEDEVLNLSMADGLSGTYPPPWPPLRTWRTARSRSSTPAPSAAFTATWWKPPRRWPRPVRPSSRSRTRCTP